MSDINDVIAAVKIQYPTLDVESLQRSLTQVKELLEDPEFYTTQRDAYLSGIVMEGGGGGDGVETLIFTVTDDAGDGTVEGDANATDYTGQSDANGTVAQIEENSLAYFSHKGLIYVYTGNRPVGIGVGGDYTAVADDFTPFGSGVSWDDIVDKPATYPPSPHTHVESDITDLDKYTQAEVDAQQAAQDAALQAHIDDKANPHDTSYNDLLDVPTEFPPSAHTHVEADITDLDRTRWRGDWVDGSSSLKNDVWLDYPWLMVANKDTDDRPGPVEDGPKEEDNNGPYVSGILGTQTALIRSGATFTFLEGGWGTKLEVWAPEIGDQIRYRVIWNDRTDPDNPVVTYVGDPVIEPNAWSTIAITNRVIASGSIIDVVLEALNSGDEVIITGGWLAGPDKVDPDEAPPTQGWGRDKHTSFNFDVNDLDSTNRVSELMSVIPGSTLRIAETADVNTNWLIVIDEYPVAYDALGVVVPGPDYTTAAWVNFQGARTENNGNPPEDDPTTCTFTVPTASPTRYTIWPNERPAETRTWANIEGYLSVDGVIDETVATNIYGVRLTFQQASVSDDFDLMAVSEAVGGGGSTGGVTEFIGLTDTPVSYAGQAGKIPTVTQDESGLEFVNSALTLQEFHDPAGVASWRIFGTTLECWGHMTTNGAASADIVPLPKSYANEEYEVLTNVRGSTNTTGQGLMSFGAPNLGGSPLDNIIINTRNTVNGAVGTLALPVSWHTIGQWDGVS